MSDDQQEDQEFGLTTQYIIDGLEEAVEFYKKRQKELEERIKEANSTIKELKESGIQIQHLKRE